VNTAKESQRAAFELATSSAARGASAALRRRFCDFARVMASSERGLYGMKRFPNAVSALKRMVGDDDVEARVKACDAVAALASTAEGAALLCTSDDALYDTAMTIREWEWTIALAKIRETFGIGTYLKCKARSMWRSEASRAYVQRFLSPQVFDELQTHRPKRYKENVDIAAVLSRVIANASESVMVLNAATNALDSLLATTHPGDGEPILFADEVPRNAASHLRGAPRKELAMLEPTEVFMGEGFSGGSASTGCLSWKRGAGQKQGEGDEEKDEEKDENDEGDAAFGLQKGAANAVSFTITAHSLARRLMMYTRHENDALRDRSCRILYDYSLLSENEKFGERIFDMLIGRDSRLRAGTLSWLAYLFTNHARLTASFLPTPKADKPPLSHTLKYLLSESMLRSASEGLNENDDSIRASAARALRAAWDAVATAPSSPSPNAETANDSGASPTIDMRLDFALNDRWLTFYNAGAVRALCDMQLSGAVGAPQLADTVLEHMAKTDREAARYILSREHSLDASAGRASTRQRIDEHKQSFGKPKLRVHALPAPEDEEQENALALREQSVAAVDAVDERVVRWREYRATHPPVTAKFLKGDLPERDDDDWRTRAEEYILAGGDASNKTDRRRRGPYERAILHDGGVGLAATFEKLPVVFAETPSIGPYYYSRDFPGQHTSAKKYVQPSERHQTRAKKRMLITKFKEVER